MLYYFLATGLGAFLVLFVLLPGKKQEFIFSDALLLFAGLGALLYGVLNLTHFLPK